MKHLKKVIYGALLLLFYVSFFFSSNVIGIIYTRHISLLAFIGLSLYDISFAYQKNILRKYNLSFKKQNILLLSRFALFGVVMILSASIQLKYIDYSYTLQERTCSIYDQYHNLVYSTPYNDGCPEVEVVSKSNEHLELYIMDQSVDRYDEITYNDIKYSNITNTTVREISVSINYENSILQYVHFHKDEWNANDTDTETFGFVTVLDQIIDYRNGYVFKTAVDGLELLTSYDDIMNYDTDWIIFTDEDYLVEEYVVTEKLTSENYIAYDLSSLENGEDSTRILEFLLAKDQTDSIMLTDYSINFEISEQAADYGLTVDAVSLMYQDSNIQIDSTKEYEGEGYYNTYVVSNDESLPILESHHLNHILNGETDYEGITTVDTFARGKQTFYYTQSKYTGVLYPESFEKFQTIEETEYGYLVIDYKYYSGSFYEYLFAPQEYNHNSYYIVGYKSTIFLQQQSLFNSNEIPFYDHLSGTFITVPIYIQKNALE